MGTGPFQLDDIEIPEIEITDGWPVRDVQTLEDCEEANAYLVAAIAGIEYQIEVEGFKPLSEQRGPWLGSAKSALRFKKAALNIVVQKRGALNEKRREEGLLAFIRSTVPPQQWLAWVTAHDAAPLRRKEAA
jgi:hypothetical protein